jgi:hypothetical protein
MIIYTSNHNLNEECLEIRTYKLKFVPRYDSDVVFILYVFSNDNGIDNFNHMKHENVFTEIEMDLINNWLEELTLKYVI